MDNQEISRRSLLKGGGTALAGLTALQVAGSAQAFGHSDGEVIPWIDRPAPIPIPETFVGNPLNWEELKRWQTPADELFYVTHYGILHNQDPSTWRVDITGLVARPQSVTLDDLKARTHREVDFAIECSGNDEIPFMSPLVGNARWGGTPLAPVLEEAGLLHNAIEVVFWGKDSGQVTIRDNVGVLRGGNTGTTKPDGEDGLDLTLTEHFARSMSVREALHPDNLLCYEMNGLPLPDEHGFPLRLIAPGWYGVANVKWLTRIEVLDHRFAGRFMARDYVSIREQKHGDETVWTFTTVNHERLKSAPAKVTRRRGRYHIMGAAWGAPVAAVEVQVDDGPWTPTWLQRRGDLGAEVQTDDESSTAPMSDGNAMHRGRHSYAWKFWHFDWGEAHQWRAQDSVPGVRCVRQHATGAGRPFSSQQSDVLGKQRANHPSRSNSLMVFRRCAAPLSVGSSWRAPPRRSESRVATSTIRSFRRQNGKSSGTNGKAS
jgi:DMSO/TMAO reductase YedYZ molybdopterin-dependent catalytic subunit